MRASYLGAQIVGEENGKGRPTVAKEGVITAGRNSEARNITNEFINATAQHRHWSRSMNDRVPALRN